MTDIKPEPHDTAEMLKMKIEKMQDEKKQSLKGKKLDEAKSPKADLIDQKAVDQASQENKVSQAAEPKPIPEKTDGKPVDLQEWAKKKGIDWTTEETVLAALRKSDEEFHKRRQEKRKDEVKPQAETPRYQPQQPQPVQPPQQYWTPQQYYNANIVENIARTYNMTVEDVERLSAFNRDMFNAMLEGERQRHQQEMAEVKRENTKNSVFRELSSDPAFRDPQVFEEFHRTLTEMQEAEPHSFDEDPTMYRRAFEKAQINMFRRNLQVTVSTGSKTDQIFGLPSNPPTPFGRGTGDRVKEQVSETMTPQDFARLDLEEQRKFLPREPVR